MFPDDFDMSYYVVEADKLHVVVDGFAYDFGTGGIHGSVSNQVFRKNPILNRIIMDVDVASYYPNMAIHNDLFPAHLGQAFCPIYLSMYELRKSFDKETHPLENLAIKLALNGAYGNSNNAHSFLYDPQYTMTITINGQLMLCMLAEQLMKIPGLNMIQINTDGMTYECDEFYRQHTLDLCRWWESITKLELEDEEYEAMYIRDVNNYTAVDMKGKIKQKSAYEHQLVRDSLWHKDFSALIVPMAAEAALLHGTDIETFLRGHTDYKHFCLRTKVNRNSKVVMRTPGLHDKELQRITRYYVANRGGTLLKFMPPTQKQIDAWDNGIHYQHESTGAYVSKTPGVKPPSGKYKLVPDCDRRPKETKPTNLQSGWLSADCSDMSDFDPSNINYDYYIKEVRKLVDPLVA